MFGQITEGRGTRDSGRGGGTGRRREQGMASRGGIPTTGMTAKRHAGALGGRAKSCAHSARLPIQLYSIVIPGYCLAEHEPELREIIPQVLSTVEGEPTTWRSIDRPWTWAERGGEIAKAAAWVGISEAVVIFLWLRSRKRRTPAKAAG
jgi:hypothetical protein